MNPELQNLLQMAMQTTAPVSTQVMPEYLNRRIKRYIKKNIRIEDGRDVNMPLYAHDSIDTEIDKDNQFTMSQMPERKIVGTGLGLLDMVGGFSKAGALVTAGTPKFMKMVSNLKTSTAFHPSTKRAVIRHAKKMRDTSPSEYAKYKDAPSRELMDVVLKLDDLMIKSPKSRVMEEARYTVDKNLFKAMKEIEKTGMEGTIVPGTEINIKNTFRTLMELMR
jgi:hypothetical protein